MSRKRRFNNHVRPYSAWLKECLPKRRSGHEIEGRWFNRVQSGELTSVSFPGLREVKQRRVCIYDGKYSSHIKSFYYVPVNTLLFLMPGLARLELLQLFESDGPGWG